MNGLVCNSPGGQDESADPFYDIVHVHIASLIAEAMIAVEDGTVHGAHTHAVSGGGDAVGGEGGVIAFEEKAAAGGVVIDREAKRLAGRPRRRRVSAG